MTCVTISRFRAFGLPFSVGMGSSAVGSGLIHYRHKGAEFSEKKGASDGEESFLTYDLPESA
jgi:hypothetical protein